MLRDPKAIKRNSKTGQKFKLGKKIAKSVFLIFDSF